MPTKSRSILAGIITTAALVLPSLSFAQFSPGPNPITGTVGAQSLSAGTGTVNAGGSISISANSVALTMTGTSTLVNNGTIQTTGTGRAIDSNSGAANLTLTNNGLVSSVSSDAFRVNTNSTVSLTNSGTIRVTAGGQAIDWAAITSQPNALINQSTGVITAVGEDAVRPGTNGTVNNAGTIAATPTGTTAPSGSDGIDLRTFTGIIVTNTGTISGKHGIATDGANAGPSTLTVNNNAGTISAVNGSGLNIDGVSTTVTANVTNAFGATIKGGVSAGAINGDGDGIDIDGVLTLNNSGDVLGLGARGEGNDTLPNGAQAVSIGGGTITNQATGRIIGSSLAVDAPNGDPTRLGEGILADNSSGGNAIAATSVTNSGLIQGKNGAAVRIIGTFADTITNQAGGTIRGAGTGAAIQMGGGNDQLTNRGAIISDIGNAISLGDGNDTLTLAGNAASITGSVAGGLGSDTIEFALGAGNSFSYSGAFSEFELVKVVSGQTTLSGANAFTSSTLDLTGGTLRIENAGGGAGQTFGSLTLDESSVLDLASNSALTFNDLGTFASGQQLAVIGFDELSGPAYALRFAGDLTGDLDFASLLAGTTINGAPAAVRFSGGFTELAAVPEPSTAAFGLLAVAAMSRRRRTR